MKTIRCSKLCVAVCLPLLLVSIGCGRADPNRGVVAGQVKLDGQPLAQGSIRFTPIEGAKGPVTGGEIRNGRYRLDDNASPTVGINRVEIRAIRKTGKMVQKPMAPAGVMTEEIVEAVAPEFNSASTLRFEVKPGDNTADFNVTGN